MAGARDVTYELTACAGGRAGTSDRSAYVDVVLVRIRIVIAVVVDATSPVAAAQRQSGAEAISRCRVTIACKMQWGQRVKCEASDVSTYWMSSDRSKL
jgi:hypothetical protein